MRLPANLLVLIHILALASATRRNGSPAVIEDRRQSIAIRDSLLEKCPSSNGCQCKKGTKQGQYCASCAQVAKMGTGGSWDHVYECNADGECCDYGYAKDCGGESTTYRCGDVMFTWD